jgi:hypothetical protein
MAATGEKLVTVDIQARPEVDPRRGLGLDTHPEGRMIVAPGTTFVGLSVAVFSNVWCGRCGQPVVGRLPVIPSPSIDDVTKLMASNPEITSRFNQLALVAGPADWAASDPAPARVNAAR